MTLSLPTLPTLHPLILLRHFSTRSFWGKPTQPIQFPHQRLCVLSIRGHFTQRVAGVPVNPPETGFISFDVVPFNKSKGSQMPRCQWDKFAEKQILQYVIPRPLPWN